MSASGRQQTSSVCSSRIIPLQKLIDATLPVTVDDGGERRSQLGQRIDGIEFAGFDQRGNCRPVLCSRVMACKERVLPIESNRPDGPLDGVVVDLYASVGQEELQAVPVFGDVGQSLAERGLRCDMGTVMDKPGLHVGDQVVHLKSGGQALVVRLFAHGKDSRSEFQAERTSARLDLVI